MDRKDFPSAFCRVSKAHFWAILAGTLILGITGCGGLGASVMRNSRTEYNLALQKSNEEQLVANLVQLRYAHSPSFLEIDGITTQLSINAEASAGYEHGREENSSVTTTDIFSFGGSVGFSSNPTITFTPLRGEDFLKQLLTPIDLEKIMLLYNSGWTLKRILRLAVQSINDIPNAKRASGPTPENVPEFQKFEEVLDLMRELEKRNHLELMFESYEDQTEVALVIQPEAWNTLAANRLAHLLNIVPGEDHYGVVYESLRAKADDNHRIIMLETRSLLSVLFFLSQSVQVPEEDIDKGVVEVTLSDKGDTFDWTKVLHNIFIVKNSQTRPSSPAVAVRYRNFWFYIEDSDVESKATLMLVSQLFALQSGQGRTITPILTLPVAR